MYCLFFLGYKLHIGYFKNKLNNYIQMRKKKLNYEIIKSKWEMQKIDHKLKELKCSKK